MKGIIALDIDGTASQNGEPLTHELISFLKAKAEKGFQIIFITGRSRLWAERRLLNLPFIYFVAPQNGAVIIEYPSGNISCRHYLSGNLIEQLPLAEKNKMAIYLGDKEEVVLWKPSSHSILMRDYLTKRAFFYKENWHESCLKKEQIPDDFISLKWFGTKDSMKKWADQLESEFSLHCPAIRDPYNEEVWIALATHLRANKGEALKRFKQIIDPDNKGVVIAAGDDFNDLSLLMASDIGIAMANAPEELKEKAKIVAHYGLIDGLKQAFKQINQG